MARILINVFNASARAHREPGRGGGGGGEKLPPVTPSHHKLVVYGAFVVVLMHTVVCIFQSAGPISKILLSPIKAFQLFFVSYRPFN